MSETLPRTQEARSGQRVAEHPNRPAPSKFRPDIEGLRAFAVVSVVLYHASLLDVRSGFIGVDVFFVISGFLITRLLMESVGARGIRALPTFYTRRIRRLLPAAMTVVVATVVAARFWAPPLSVRPIAVDGIFTTFYGLNYRLAVEGTQYLNEGSAASPLQHFWSLAVEEQFYLCWPILIVIVVLVGRRYRNVLLALLLVAIVALSFRYSVIITKTDAPWAYFSMGTRAWELSLGALVAVSTPALAKVPRPLAWAGGWLGLAAVVASAFAYNGRTPYPGSAAALPVVGAAVVIACGCATVGGAGRLLGLRPLQFGGRMSYSWYLWHWPMLVIAPMVLHHALTWPQRLVVVVLSLAAAVITFRLIENPARSLKMPNLQWFASGAALSGSAVAAAVLVIALVPPLAGSGRNARILQVSTAASRSVALQMEAAVNAGLKTTAAPANLTPEPAKAHGDLPPSSFDGCHADYPVIKQGPCVFGDPQGKYTVVLFGDSHMQQWQPAFVAAGVRDHWRVVNWTKSACTPAQMTLYNDQIRRVYTECDVWRTLTLRRIALLHPTVVVLTGLDSEAPAGWSPASVAAAMATTVRTLQKTTTAKIVYLEDTPYPLTNMAFCVAGHLNDVRACNFPLARAYVYPARHEAIDATMRSLGVTLVNPAPWICPQGACPAVVGNLLVYRDESHLSPQFTAWLAPMFMSLLDGWQPHHAS